MLSDRYRKSTLTEIARLKQVVARHQEMIEVIQAKIYPLQASIEMLEQALSADAEAVRELALEKETATEQRLFEEEGKAA